MKLIDVVICAGANKDHMKNIRYYAHTFHKKDKICVASAFQYLPLRIRLAILLHEVGHLIVGVKGSENDANIAIEKVTGIPISYVCETPYGKDLEDIPTRYIPSALSFLGMSTQTKR